MDSNRNPSTPGGEGVLANFFNSLLTKKSGTSSPGGSSASGSPRPNANGLNETPEHNINITRSDAAAELDRLTRSANKDLDFSQSDCWTAGNHTILRIHFWCFPHAMYIIYTLLKLRGWVTGWNNIHPRANQTVNRTTTKIMKLKQSILMILFWRFIYRSVSVWTFSVKYSKGGRPFGKI